MATDKMTCGADCGMSHMESVTGLEGQETNRVWVWSDAVVAAMYDGTRDFPRSGHCPKCGRPLSFAPDGKPVVGASYAELAKKAAALDRLEDNHQHIHWHPPIHRWTVAVSGSDVERAVMAQHLLDLGEALPEEE